MDLPDLAAALLAAANTATLTRPLDRSVLVGGPNFAKDCRMIAVHPIGLSEQSQSSGDAGFGFAPCAYRPRYSLGVVFVADCYPRVNSDARPPTLPPAADLTAWTADFLADVAAVESAVRGAVVDGLLGACANVAISGGVVTGPEAGACWLTIPVTVDDDTLGIP